MSADVTILVDEVPRRVPADATVAAALLSLGVTAFRRDLGGAPRGPVCGIGSCHECRLTIDGVAEVRSCLVGVREGMQIRSAQ